MEPLCMLEDWEKMDTSGVADVSDERLLQLCTCAGIASGWGQLAELMKRYAHVRGIEKVL